MAMIKHDAPSRFVSADRTSTLHQSLILFKRKPVPTTDRSLPIRQLLPVSMVVVIILVALLTPVRVAVPCDLCTLRLIELFERLSNMAFCAFFHTSKLAKRKAPEGAFPRPDQ